MRCQPGATRRANVRPQRVPSRSAVEVSKPLTRKTAILQGDKWHQHASGGRNNLIQCLVIHTLRHSTELFFL